MGYVPLTGVLVLRVAWWVALRPARFHAPSPPGLWGDASVGEGEPAPGVSYPLGFTLPPGRVHQGGAGRNPDAHGSEAGGWSWGGLTHLAGLPWGRSLGLNGGPSWRGWGVGPDGLRTLSTASLWPRPCPSVGWMVSWRDASSCYVTLLGAGFGAREGVAGVDRLADPSCLPHPLQTKKGYQKTVLRSTRPRWSRCPSSTLCSTTSGSATEIRIWKWAGLLPGLGAAARPQEQLVIFSAPPAGVRTVRAFASHGAARPRTRAKGKSRVRASPWSRSMTLDACSRLASSSPGPHFRAPGWSGAHGPCPSPWMALTEKGRAAVLEITP